MSKGLEALNEIIDKFVEILLVANNEKSTAVNISSLNNTLRLALHDKLDIIEKELKDYQTLTAGLILGDMSIVDNKKLKALDIIKEKRVDVDCLIDCFQYDGFRCTTGLIEYNHSITKTQEELIQEEYDLLKEVLL